MIQTNELRIHYNAIPDRISSYFGDRIKDQHELDMWDYDLRNQTLLHRDAAGYYEFAHKSLAEYFVAFKFAAELGSLAMLFSQTYCEGDGQPCELPITQKDIAGLAQTFGVMALKDAQMGATCSLLREMITGNAAKRLWRLINETKGRPLEEVKYVGGNAATLLNQMGKSFARRNLRGVVLAGAHLVGADLTNADLSGAFLDDANLMWARLKSARCISTSFRTADLLNTTMEHAIFEGVDFSKANLEYANSIFTISYSPDGRRIASGGISRQIMIWDSRSGKKILSCDGHTDSVQAVIFSPIGNYLASGGGDGYVRVWDTLTGNEVWSKKIHKGYVRGLSYDSTGKWLASVGDDGRLIIWEARIGKKHFQVSMNDPLCIRCVSFSPNGTLLSVGADTGMVVLWDLRTRSEASRWQAHEMAIFVAFSADSRLLISGGVDQSDKDRSVQIGGIKVWEAPQWCNIMNISFNNDAGGLLHGALSPRETYVAGRTGDSDVAIWDYQTGEQLFLLKGHYATVFSTFFSPDGHYMASSSEDGSIRIWNVKTGIGVRHIIQYKDCEGSRFTDIKGLDARTCEWLRDRGATI